MVLLLLPLPLMRLQRPLCAIIAKARERRGVAADRWIAAVHLSLTAVNTSGTGVIAPRV